ncbi:MAG TPA: hypothetical protein VMI11_01800 [Actinomycetes bacterium]|nr:hypothetical protein [Actinomycetes bacterium]
MSEWVNVSALSQALLGGLVCGVGIVVFFALGLVGVSSAQDAPPVTRVVRLTGAAVCFALVVLAIATGLYVILTD